MVVCVFSVNFVEFIVELVFLMTVDEEQKIGFLLFCLGFVWFLWKLDVNSWEISFCE